MQKTSRAEADKPPKADGARKRSASQAPPEGMPGGNPGGNADREQRAEIPGGNNENEKNIF
jgi:hypothetical protein